MKPWAGIQQGKQAKKQQTTKWSIQIHKDKHCTLLLYKDTRFNFVTRKCRYRPWHYGGGQEVGRTGPGGGEGQIKKATECKWQTRRRELGDLQDWGRERSEKGNQQKQRMEMS